MIGNPGVPALVDIALKGFDVDKNAVFEAAKASAMLDERGMGLLKKYVIFLVTSTQSMRQ